MVLSHLVEFLLAIVLVFAEVTKLVEEGAGSNYRILVLVVVMLNDAVRVYIIVLVASSVPLRLMWECREFTPSDTDNAFKWMQLLLSYTAVFLGIISSMWHAACVFSLITGATAHSCFSALPFLW